jgi:small subunit ribosomal protein S9
MTTTNKYFYGVGRRKTSTARAKYFPSAGDVTVTINKKPLEVFFPEFYAKNILIALTNLAITTGTLEMYVNGGGTSSQSEACRLAIAKSLVKMDEGNKVVARMHGYMTTDPRQVLPKKAGFRKARKVEQWSKR